MSAYPPDLTKEIFARLSPHIGIANLPGLGALLDAAFISSFRTDESRPARFTLSVLSRECPDPEAPVRRRVCDWVATPLGCPLPVTARELSKLGQVGAADGAMLAVDTTTDPPLIWGLIDQSVHYAAFLRHSREPGPPPPGIVQVSVEGPGRISVTRDYGLLAALVEGRLVRTRNKPLHSESMRAVVGPWIDNHVSRIRESIPWDEMRELDDRLPSWQGLVTTRWITLVARLLLRIRSFGHGGSVLLDKARSDEKPFTAFDLPYDRLRVSFERWCCANFRHWIHGGRLRRKLDRVGATLEFEQFYKERGLLQDDAELHDEINGCLEFIAGLSRLDGALVFRDGLTLACFGAELQIVDPGRNVTKAGDDEAVKREPMSLDGLGTRHRSMIRYCAKYPGCLGFVISQDGDVRTMTVLGDELVYWTDVDLPLDAQPVGDLGVDGFLQAR
jgi:hypothetical protein